MTPIAVKTNKAANTSCRAPGTDTNTERERERERERESERETAREREREDYCFKMPS